MVISRAWNSLPCYIPVLQQKKACTTLRAYRNTETTVPSTPSLEQQNSGAIPLLFFYSQEPKNLYSQPDTPKVQVPWN